MQTVLFWGGLILIMSVIYLVISLIEITIFNFLLKRKFDKTNLYNALIIIPLQLFVAWISASFAGKGIDLAFGGAGVVLAFGIVSGGLVGVILIPFTLIRRNKDKTNH